MKLKNYKIQPNNLKQISLRISFDNLESNTEYEVCIGISSLQARQTQLTCDKSRQTWFSVNTTKTTCQFLQRPKYPPTQIEWTSNSDFNPFTQIKVGMEANNFIGHSSGLRRFQFL